MTVTQLREGDYRPDGAGGLPLPRAGQGYWSGFSFCSQPVGADFPCCRRWAADCICCLGRGPRPGEHWGPAMPRRPWRGEENLRVLGAVWTEETRTLTVELEWQGEPMQAVLDAAALGWQDRQEDRQEAGSI